MVSIVKADVWQNTAGVTRGTVLQTAYGESLSRLSGTTNNFLDVITGVGWTPTTSTTKALITGQLTINPMTGNESVLRLYVSVNGGAYNAIGNSTATSNLPGVSVGWVNVATGWQQFTMPFTYLYTHNTTQPLLFKIAVTPQDGGGTTFYVNGSNTTTGTDSAAGISTLMVQEIAA